MIPGQLLYDLADVTQTPIYESNKAIRGFSEQVWNLGDLWKLKFDLTVCVDHRSEVLVTAFVHVRKNLWFYYVGTEGQQWMLAFDGDRAKIRVGGEKEFSTGKPEETLKRLKPAITRAFVCDAKGLWKPDNADHLLSGLT